MRKKIVFTQDQLDRIEKLYKSGHGLERIGVEFGVSKRVISRIIKEFNIYSDDRSLELHKDRLQKLGRVELVGDWINTQTKTLYFCLEHKETHMAFPGNVTKGCGLACCLREGAKSSNQERVIKHESVYDERIEEVSGGRIVRLGNYQGTKVPIEHHCRVHNETHPARPGNVLSGMGLICCKRVAWEGLGDARNIKAKEKYDVFLAERSEGRFTRLDEYIDATTPILHYCSVHNEEHVAIPNHLTNGNGMACCNTGVGWDTLENILEGNPVNIDSAIEEPCQFYIFHVPNTEDCVKIGIAKNSYRRSRHPGSRDLYGDLVSLWQCSTRRNAILLETAVLRDSSFEHPSDLLISLEFKNGQTEVRRVDIDDLVDHVQDLFDSLEREGISWSNWALDRIPSLRSWEKKVLEGIVGCRETDG